MGSERAYQALRHRDFRLLWSAELLSSLGTQVQRVAVAWHVFQLTGDPVQLGLLGLCRFVPILLFGIAGVVVADRGDRRRTLVAAQLLLAGTSATLATLVATGTDGLLAIYALTFCAATFGAVSNPTRQALVPAIVPRSSLAGAVTANILAFQVAAVAGPAVGGLVIGQVGLAAAYGFDALSFVVVVASLLAIRAPATLAPPPGGGLAAAREGLRFLRSSPVLLGVMSLDFVATFFGASTVLMPIFATEVLDVGATGLGLLLAGPAVGAAVASAWMGFARTMARPGFGVLVAVAVYGACILGFGLSRDLRLSLVLLAGGGAADAVSMALRHSVRTLATPDALRGRVAAAHSTFAMGGPQLGEFEAGVLAAAVGAGPSVALGGLGTVLAAGVIAALAPGIAAYRAPLAVAPIAAPTPAPLTD